MRREMIQQRAVRAVFSALLVAAAPARGGERPKDPAGPAASGPVLRLDYTGQATNDIGIADFMYFVGLISPEPVTVSESPTNTLRVRVTGIRQEMRTDRFSLHLAFAVSGEGFRHYAIDPSANLRRHARRLEAGEALTRQLDYIRFEGPGRGRVDVEGRVEGAEKTVTSVRLRFNDGGGTSPVTIGLKDIRSVHGAYRFENELVSRVNSLEFVRGGPPPRMAVLIDSVKRKEAGHSLLQDLKGQIVGMVANLLLDPIVIEECGNDAMLDFGRALWNRDPTFAFPAAKNLRLADPCVVPP